MALLSRPATFGHVLATWAMCFVLLVSGYHLFRERGSDIQQESRRADTSIIESGQRVIRNGCEFDNVRAAELRGILRNGLKNQRKQFLSGALPRERYVESRRATKQAIKDISIRDCKHEAAQFKSELSGPAAAAEDSR